MRNLYQCLLSTYKSDFSIADQVNNNQESILDYQKSNHNSGITHSNFVIAELMRPYIKQLTQVVKYNKNFDSYNNDKDIEFLDIDLFSNKLNLQLLVYNSTICTKKKLIIIDDKDDELP